MQTEIPKVNIPGLSDHREDDIMISRFSEYLSEHQHLILPHRHNFYHLLFFTKGAGRHTIDFNHFDVVPYQIYFMVPGQVHSWNFEGEVDGYVVNFSTGFFQSFLLRPDYLESYSFFNAISENSVINLSDEVHARIEGLFEDLIHTKAVKTHLGNDMIRVLLLQIFIHVENESNLKHSGIDARHNNALLRNFRKLIEQQYKALRLPSEYADLLNVTPSHLNAVCRDHLGIQAGALIRDRIILEAKRLLVNLNLTISEVSYALNFNDNSYFTKFFKKEVGLTPEAFRKRSTVNAPQPLFQ